MCVCVGERDVCPSVCACMCVPAMPEAAGDREGKAREGLLDAGAGGHGPRGAEISAVAPPRGRHQETAELGGDARKEEA